MSRCGLPPLTALAPFLGVRRPNQLLSKTTSSGRLALPRLHRLPVAMWPRTFGTFQCFMRSPHSPARQDGPVHTQAAVRCPLGAWGWSSWCYSALALPLVYGVTLLTVLGSLRTQGSFTKLTGHSHAGISSQVQQNVQCPDWHCPSPGRSRSTESVAGSTRACWAPSYRPCSVTALR